MNIEINNVTVTNDGESIGTIEGDTCTLAAKVAPNIKGAINKAAGRKLTFVVGTEDTEEEKPEAPASTPAKGSNLTGIDRLLALAEAGKIPAPPPTRPDMGDKTPAYVEWFRKHATADECEKKYPSHRRLVSESEADAAEAKRREKAEQVENKFKV